MFLSRSREQELSELQNYIFVIFVRTRIIVGYLLKGVRALTDSDATRSAPQHGENSANQALFCQLTQAASVFSAVRSR